MFGFRGEIRVLTTTGPLPREAYDADVFVGATNVPNVIAVEQLRPGAIVVDDSFPLCFDLAAALRRFRQSGDILFASGGSVQVPGGVSVGYRACRRRSRALPAAASPRRCCRPSG